MIQNEKERLLKAEIIEIINSYFPEPSENRIYYSSNFEISPRDFLLLAEQNIFSSKNVDLINGISNLKRAIDCSMNSFFNSLGIFKKLNSMKIDKRKINVSDKLSFIGELANFTPQSIIRLNKIRNELEHEYKLPRTQEVQVYYDLVFALIIVNENLCFMHSSLSFNDNTNRFFSKYDVSKGSLLFSKSQLEIENVKNREPEQEEEENNNYSIEITLKDGVPLFRLALKCHRALSLLTDRIFTQEQTKRYLNFT